jgi:hypothetical protein
MCTLGMQRAGSTHALACVYGSAVSRQLQAWCMACAGFLVSGACSACCCQLHALVLQKVSRPVRRRDDARNMNMIVRIACSSRHVPSTRLLACSHTTPCRQEPWFCASDAAAVTTHSVRWQWSALPQVDITSCTPQVRRRGTSAVLQANTLNMLF